MMDASIDTTADTLETAILLALHMKGRKSFTEKQLKGRGGLWQPCDMSTFCPPRPMFPSNMFGIVTYDLDRLYSDSVDYLACDPVKLVGTGVESVLIDDDGTVKWTGIRPMPAPRGLIAMTNAKTAWFAIHYREIRADLTEVYQCRPFPLCGRSVPLVKALAWPKDDGGWLRDAAASFALTLSIIEDTIRAGSILATVQEHTVLNFAVPEDSYKDFFAMRDGYRNTPTGRRNPILHWCATHMRKRADKDKPVIVSGHIRGAEEISHGAMRLSLSRNEGYGAFI